MSTSKSLDPFQVLGVKQDATEAEIRARYLELVKEFPPEQNPEGFREIRAAYEAAKDPLIVARRLLVPPPEEAPKWSDAINAQKERPPALTLDLLLSLGNRSSDDQKQHRVDPPHE